MDKRGGIVQIMGYVGYITVNSRLEVVNFIMIEWTTNSNCKEDVRISTSYLPVEYDGNEDDSNLFT